MKLYNTASRSVEEFVPIENGKVKMYCCGPTVYGYQHIGNFRSFFFEDILKRVLQYNGYDVKHVMNITDVGHLTSDEDSGDDKMEKKAAEEGKTVWEVSKFFTDIFMKDMELLNIIPPNTFPKATEYIQEQIEMVKELEAKGFTYVTSDGVYYDTSKFPDYGKMARLDIEGLRAGERVEFSEEKKNPTDFSVWKFSPKNEKRQMEWDSPWGKGFPGWHLECSAMSKKLLGNHFDIHCGGVDHIPVHHTNEIAQSEAANGEKFVNYWVHGEFLLMGDEKMSKSKGGTLTLARLKEEGFEPMHYRYFLLNAHYRKKLNFSEEGLQGAKNAYEKLKERILSLKEKAANENLTDTPNNYKEKFLEKINNDLGITEALAVLWTMLKDDTLSAKQRLELAYDFDKVFGLQLDKMEKAEAADDIPGEVKSLAGQRMQAKKDKNFALSDELRNKIKEMGYEVKDSKDGYELKRL
ncbi:MAG: cysteine--tRNA ligase [Ignavibacteria bacterium]|nr:cysteine--tRNA ligase [Ignavibacteria bacterium]